MTKDEGIIFTSGLLYFGEAKCDMSAHILVMYHKSNSRYVQHVDM